MKTKSIVYTVAILTIVLMLVSGFIKTSLIEKKSTQSTFMLDTYISMTVYGKNSDQAIKKCVSEISELEKVFSAYDKSSELYKLNSSSDSIKPVSKELSDITEKAIDYSKKTNNKFDITIKPIIDLWKISDGGYVPTDEEIALSLKNVGISGISINRNQIEFKNKNAKIDLGGIAKGYCADACAELLIKENISNALLDFGGNICALGKNPETKSNWNIGIKKPFDKSGEPLGKISCTSEKTFIVTSGAYERNFTSPDGTFYHHIFDPKTGKPFDGIFDSVTVISDNCTMADAFSTALFLCNITEAFELAENNGIEIVLISKDKNIYTNCDEFELLDNSYTVIPFN